MANLRKILTFVVVLLAAGGGAIFGKWYYTTAMEPIDPDRGIYGMAGLEIWIDLNAALPSPLRTWGCETLRARERDALGGQNSLAPYGCQPGFGAVPTGTMSEMMIQVNVDQAGAGLDQAAVAALRSCVEAGIAAAFTPEAIAAINDEPGGDAMTGFAVAVSEQARSCKAGANP